MLELLGRGRSNAEIAQALVVSTGTAKTHVANVFSKLGLRDRAAVVFAYESGLIRPGAQMWYGIAPGPARRRHVGAGTACR